MHVIHHHALPKHTNSNYGFVFSFWDKLFGTSIELEMESNWKFGLKYAKDQSLTKRLYYPFTKKHLRNL